MHLIEKNMQIKLKQAVEKAIKFFSVKLPKLKVREQKAFDVQKDLKFPWRIFEQMNFKSYTVYMNVPLYIKKKYIYNKIKEKCFIKTRY